MAIADLRLGALALLVAAAVGGCGGSARNGDAPANGLASQSAQQILDASGQAARGAHSVHVSGTISDQAQPLRLDLDVVNGKGASGTITVSGLRVDVVDVANAVYLKGSDMFWKHFASTGAAQLLRGKWLKSPATGSFAAFAQFTNLAQLFNRVFSGHGTLTKGAETTIGGQKVITVHDSRGANFYVATTGKPYPVSLTKAGSGGGTVHFSDYNHQFAIAAPPGAVDISTP